MALESNNNEGLLGGGDDDFAALDSMGYTGQSQYGMNTVNMSTPSSSSFGSNNSGGAPSSSGGGTSVGDNGRDNGFSGVSGSLFDRIRARTAEQQKQSISSSQPQQQQEAAQSSSQQYAFVSQQQQPSSGEPTMELERNGSDPYNTATVNAFIDNAVNNGAGTSGAPSAYNQNNNNETTYSFSASAPGEDFSQAAAPGAGLRVPQYGASRDDPYYAALNNQNAQQYPTSIQEKAVDTMKSLWDAGLNGAQTISAMVQAKLGSDGVDATPRSYNNNFLLREDSMEHGMGGPSTTGTMNQQQQPPPPPMSTSALDPETAAAGQGYSMLKYGKTFCEDVFAFVMQLPPAGKGAVGVVLLWVLYVLFG